MKKKKSKMVMDGSFISLESSFMVKPTGQLTSTELPIGMLILLAIVFFFAVIGLFSIL